MIETLMEIEQYWNEKQGGSIQKVKNCAEEDFCNISYTLAKEKLLVEIVTKNYYLLSVNSIYQEYHKLKTCQTN